MTVLPTTNWIKLSVGDNYPAITFKSSILDCYRIPYDSARFEVGIQEGNFSNISDLTNSAAEKSGQEGMLGDLRMSLILGGLIVFHEVTNLFEFGTAESCRGVFNHCFIRYPQDSLRLPPPVRTVDFR